jgi:hypothetical protein
MEQNQVGYKNSTRQTGKENPGIHRVDQAKPRSEITKRNLVDRGSEASRPLQLLRLLL